MRIFNSSFRQLVLATLLLFLPFTMLADRGMWLPFLLNEIEGEMQDAGLKLSAEDIYSVNKSSLKDAVVRFGGGCTGEIISDQGLLLTNHHCGYSYITKHSTVENNRLENGFWAMNKGEELACPGLSVTFIVKMEDVTKLILADLDGLSDVDRESKIATRIEDIQNRTTEGTDYKAEIKPFYYGLEYYMTVTQTYNDVRMVGTPPEAVGKFGGDTDNWMWPRHTGDFSVFRIYADKDNNPAEYSEDNVPYKPKHHFPVNLGGIKEGDFTMVFGFPGRTQQYLPSIAVKQLIHQINPPRIDIRKKKLKVLDKYMNKDAAIRLKYASPYARIANYYKKWDGETRGLKLSEAYSKKLDYENRMMTWLREPGNEDANKKYSGVLSNLESLYKTRVQMQQAYDVYREAGYGSALSKVADRVATLYELPPGEELDERKAEIAEGLANGYDNLDLNVEKDLLAASLKMILKEERNIFLQDWVLELKRLSKGNMTEHMVTLWSKSVFADKEKLIDMVSNFSPKKGKKTANDPFYLMYKAMKNNHENNVLPKLREASSKIEAEMKIFMEAQRAFEKDRRFSPDANSTLRLTYGKVERYKSFSDVEHEPFTYLDGLMAKENPKNREFHVPAKLKELYQNKDYGKYAVNGTVPVCFIASNHTTGGNSGSPLLNANGELVGINFDRNWEGTMSDVNYDVTQVRNISTDIRYILFIMDKLGGAGHLVEEMTIIGG
ncbi:MAG: hypothetical protein ACI9FU_000999 [Granulosicoccus sp.]|jgi:hypothetical protein